MSGFGGYIDWTVRLWLENLYLDGRTFEIWGPEETVTVAPSDGVIRLETAAGTHVVQTPYRGAKAPLKMDAHSFSVSFIADGEDDYVAFEIARSMGQAVEFCLGFDAFDSFQAESGQVYTLTRPIANGIVPQVSDAFHPVQVFLDRVRDDSAAEVAVQSVTAAATGLITVRYVALHRVVFLEVRKEMQDEQTLVLTATLDECIDGVFS